jgi:hypothetical protein
MAPEKSLVVLVAPERRQFFRTGFEQALLERSQSGVRELLLGNWDSGIRQLKGLGNGLTPGGDDLLTGFLLGLRLVQHINGHDTTSARQQIYASAIGENLISNTFLYCARKGWLFEKWKRAVAYLSGEQGLSSNAGVRDLLTIGETSGADTAVGLLLAVEYSINC